MESQDVLAPSNFKVAHEMTVTFTSEEIQQSSFLLDPCSVVQITRLATDPTANRLVWTVYLAYQSVGFIASRVNCTRQRGLMSMHTMQINLCGVHWYSIHFLHTER